MCVLFAYQFHSERIVIKESIWTIFSTNVNLNEFIIEILNIQLEILIIDI